MKVTLESTSKIVELNGVQARIWKGTTESGIEVHAFITRISVNKNEEESVIDMFRNELMEQKPPTEKIQAIPLRLII